MTTAEFKFNPNQPRDDDGRWTDGPGGSPTDDFPVYKGEPIAGVRDHVGKPWYGVEDWADVRVNLDKHMQIATAYDRMPEWDDRAKPAYDALISELDDQYRLLTDTLGYTVEVVDHDPYPDVEALMADMRDNKRIRVLATAATPPGHAYMTDAENDRFRAVHDAFGHAGTGRGFDRHGEEAAYQAHANMFSPLARKALASETRGQNSVLIRSVEQTGVGMFPPQKFALVTDVMPTADLTTATALVAAAGDRDNLYDVSGIHHTSLGRHPRGMTDAEQEAWRARRDRARSEPSGAFRFNPSQPRDDHGRWTDWASKGPGSGEFDILLVGGAVRDQAAAELTGDTAKVNDADFVVVGPASHEELVKGLQDRGFTVFADYPDTYTVKAKVPESMPELRAMADTADFVLARRESDTADGRRPDAMEPGTLGEDLARRDFTVNAMARTPDGEIIDLHGGMADLENGVLRFVGDPHQRVSEDALRVMRGFRFMVTKGLKPDPATWAALISPEAAVGLSARDSTGKRVVSLERMSIEINKMLSADTTAALDLLASLPKATRDAMFPEGLRLQGTMKKGSFSIEEWLGQFTTGAFRDVSGQPRIPAGNPDGGEWTDGTTALVKVSDIVPENNDRKSFDREALQTLADSIAKSGLAQPITIRPRPAHMGEGPPYVIVAGERRWRAMQLLGETEIPAIVKNYTDEEASNVMLAENVARADLNPMDEANAYGSRMEKYGYTTAELADATGVSVKRIQTYLPLLKLAPAIAAQVQSGQLPMGHALALVNNAGGSLDHNRQHLAYQAWLKEDLSVAQLRHVTSKLLDDQNQGSMFDPNDFMQVEKWSREAKQSKVSKAQIVTTMADLAEALAQHDPSHPAVKQAGKILGRRFRPKKAKAVPPAKHPTTVDQSPWWVEAGWGDTPAWSDKPLVAAAGSEWPGPNVEAGYLDLLDWLYTDLRSIDPTDEALAAALPAVDPYGDGRLERTAAMTADSNPTGQFYSETQPRDDHGRWTDGPGGGGGPAKLAPDGQIPPSEIERIQNQDGPAVQAKDADEAVAALLAGKKVEITNVGDVAVVLDKIRKYVKKAKKEGKDAPDLNLCSVTIKGSSLFCVTNKGIPRIEMPQFSGATVPGSKAAGLADEKGNANVQAQFRDHLASKGVKLTDTDVAANTLKATQNELVGAKVAGIAKAVEKGTKDPGLGDRLFVSRDGYIVDGHHRWAAMIGADARDGVLGDDYRLPVTVIDMDILDLIGEANSFTDAYGIARKAGSGPNAGAHTAAAAWAQSRMASGMLYIPEEMSFTDGDGVDDPEPEPDEPGPDHRQAALNAAATALAASIPD